MPGVSACSYKKGSYIIRQGEPITFVYYLAGGTCYRSYINEAGEENIYNYWQAGNYIGALTLIADPSLTVSVSNMVAKTDCVGYKIPKESFLILLDEEPELVKALLYRAIEEIHDMNQNYMYMKDGKIANRICQVLLERAEEVEGQYIVDKSFTNAEQAKLLGVHPVTISRIMKALKEEGTITKGKHGITLTNRMQLERYSKGEKVNYK